MQPPALWPQHEGLFGASDASRNNPHPTTLATEDESKLFSLAMQLKTKATTFKSPHLDLVAYFKRDTDYTTQALKDSETEGKEKPILVWIYFHKGVNHPTGKDALTTAPGWFLCEAYQKTGTNKKTASVHYNILQHPFDQETRIAISADRLRQHGNITTSTKLQPIIKHLTTNPELDNHFKLPNMHVHSSNGTTTQKRRPTPSTPPTPRDKGINNPK
jgi:hypothetical protein